MIPLQDLVGSFDEITCSYRRPESAPRPRRIGPCNVSSSLHQDPRFGVGSLTLPVPLSSSTSHNRKDGAGLPHGGACSKSQSQTCDGIAPANFFALIQ